MLKNISAQKAATLYMLSSLHKNPNRDFKASQVARRGW